MTTPHSDILTSTGGAALKDVTEAFDPYAIRQDFPILHLQVHGKPLIYLDNAATTHKPQVVIEAIDRYYREQNANIHRGVYHLSQLATDLYERARKKIAAFINAPNPAQCLFTRGTTEAINLVSTCWGRTFLKPGDEVIVSAMEHHSDIVPWQIACEATGATLRVIPMNDAGELLMDEYERMLSERTTFVSVVHVSNSLGTINDVETIIRLAHKVGAKVLVDGAQYVAHYPTDVQALDADFYAFSGHKMYGPTGIGVLYGRRELLEQMPPFQGGGDMIESVTFEKTTYAPLPNKFEAGTPHIAGGIALGVAVDYLQSLNFSFVWHEEELLDYATKRLKEVPGLRLIGTAKRKASVLSFVMEDPPMSALDLGIALDREGIACRTGHHCCQPVMDRFGIPATTRASLTMYNTKEDVDALVSALKRIRSSAPKINTNQKSAAEPTLRWPAGISASPAEAAEELAEMFEMMDDPSAKQELVLDLGRQLPNAFDTLKSLTPRVPGCMSEVYLIGRRVPEDPQRVQFMADANADIVRGLIAVLQRLYSGQRADEIIAFDIEAFFRRIGLEQFITAQRRNGLAGMIRKIHALAAELPKA